MRNRRRFAVRTMALGLAILIGGQFGCNSGPSGWSAPSVTRIFSPSPVVDNPFVVPSTDFETLWNKTIAVVDKYFDIESENRLARTIKTQPQMGATIFEPWALDSATVQDRVEATLQTIRRVAIIQIDPRRPEASWSGCRSSSIWKTWPNPSASQPVARSLPTIFQSIAFVRSWVRFPLHSDGSTRTGTPTSSRPSWLASVTLYFCNWRSATNLYPILSLRSSIPTCIVSAIQTARERDRRRLAGETRGPSFTSLPSRPGNRDDDSLRSRSFARVDARSEQTVAHCRQDVDVIPGGCRFQRA